MKNLAIAAVMLWALFQFGGMLLSSQNRGSETAFARLIEAPQRSIENPYHNGYFYLFGFTAGPSSDPAQTGYEIWVDETEDTSPQFAERKATRADLVYAVSENSSASLWDAEDPLTEFRKKDASFQTALAEYRILLSRYERWTGMPFDDWGFGRRVTLLWQEIAAIHRLYVAEGFSISTVEGLERLRKDFHVWRTVLREAKTINTKVFAQIVITDNLRLLSRLLARPTVDHAILTMGLQLTLPLSTSEYSLRWPIRHQVALAVKEHRETQGHERDQERRRQYQHWLSHMGHLPDYAFDGIIHPAARTATGNFEWGQSDSVYAAYYEAIINASETHIRQLPKMQEVLGTLQHGMLEGLVHSRPRELDWETFHAELVETDTRLRLASLQIQLRHPSAQSAVPTRLAEVGSQYFDPFTGLPMLWSPSQQKLYSVGRDRLDDGGDPTFDISVPAVVGQMVVKSGTTGPTAARSVRR